MAGFWLQRWGGGSAHSRMQGCGLGLSVRRVGGSGDGGGRVASMQASVLICGWVLGGRVVKGGSGGGMGGGPF